MWVLSPGQRVDRYLVEALIGTGGVSVVYRVRHTHLDSVHAMKLLVADTPAVRKRMRREGRVQFALRHPNIVRVTDLLEVEGRPALIMEYVDGPTLKDWFLRDRPPLSDTLRVFRVVVDAVGFAHAHGHVHRDLKPGNVLLAQADGGLVPKVTDFGIVKTLRGVSGGTTQQGVFMGTPEYTAPEQIQSAAHVDHRADLFALGCMLYELACGQLAFSGPDVMATLAAVRRGAYVEPTRLAPDVPEPVVRAIHGLLKAEPERRIQSCAKLLEVLAEVPDDAPPRTDRPTGFVDLPSAGDWQSIGEVEPMPIPRPPPDPGDIEPTRVVEMTPKLSTFDDAALSGTRALAHRLTLEILALQQGSQDPSLLAARYASAVSGLQGLRRTVEPLDLPDVLDLARGLVDLADEGRQANRPLAPPVVDAVIHGMDAVLMRLEAHAERRAPSKSVMTAMERAARVVAELAGQDT